MSKKLHFIFLNKTFSDKQGNIKLFQIVENIENEYSVNTKVVSLEELKELYENGSKDSSIVFDFKIVDGYLQCENIINTKLDSAELDKIKGVTSNLKSPIINIYSLFTDIVDNDGYYIDRTDETHIGSVNMLEGVVKFIPVYSKSTMTVSLSVNTLLGWKTRKLIYTDEGKLVTNEFAFYVDVEKKDIFKKYNIGYVGDFLIRNKKRSVFKFINELSVYAFNIKPINVYPSIINRYTFMSELYGHIYKTSDQICTTINKALAKPEDEERPKHDRSLYVSKYTNSYVVFELCRKRVNMVRRFEYVKDILDNVEPRVRSKEFNRRDIIKHLKALNLDYIEQLIYLVIFDILVNSGSSPMDRVEKCISVSESYKKRKFRTDTFLYMFRSCFFAMGDSLGPLTEVELVGSDIPYKTAMKRRVLND